MKRIYLVLFCLLMVSACAQGGNIGDIFSRRVPAMQPDGAKSDSAKQIALLVPLTGNGSKVGKSIMDAAKLAVDESLETGFVVTPYDTSDSAEGAKSALNAAIKDGAKFVIGPLYGSQTKAIAPIAAEKNINVISFSNDKAVAGKSVYIFGLIPEQQISQVIRYAANKGVVGFSALIPSDTFGQEVKTSLDKNASGKIRKVEVYSAKSTDFKYSAGEIARAYKEQNIQFGKGDSEAIIIAEGGQKLENAIAALKEKGINTNKVRILGSYLWDNEDLYGVDGIYGAWFASIPRKKMQEFKAKFSGAYGYQPEVIAALGYDAAGLAIKLAKSNFSDSAITGGSFSGVTGGYKFGASGINNRTYEIQEVSKGYIVPAAKN